jgi:hypothetical protein
MTTPTPNAMPGATLPPPLASTQAEPPTPAPPAVPAADEPPATPPVADPPKPDAPKPPWEANGEPFDPQRAWNLIQNLRGDLDKAKPVLDDHERLRRASMEDQDRLKEDLDKAAARETTWKNQAIRAQAEAMATGKFISTKAAVAMIGDLSVYGTDEGIDIPKLQARLDQLAAEEPNLVVPQGRQGFAPNRGQGQPGAGQMPLEAQIKAAQESGNIAQSIALKQAQKYAKQ